MRSVDSTISPAPASWRAPAVAALCHDGAARWQSENCETSSVCAHHRERRATAHRPCRCDSGRRCRRRSGPLSHRTPREVRR
jgi:hypothetical protein